MSLITLCGILLCLSFLCRPRTVAVARWHTTTATAKTSKTATTTIIILRTIRASSLNITVWHFSIQCNLPRHPPHTSHIHTYARAHTHGVYNRAYTTITNHVAVWIFIYYAEHWRHISATIFVIFYSSSDNIADDHWTRMHFNFVVAVAHLTHLSPSCATRSWYDNFYVVSVWTRHGPNRILWKCEQIKNFQSQPE